MDDAIFPLPQLHWLALELLPRAARGYADVVAQMLFALLLAALLRFAVFPLLARASLRNSWPYDEIVIDRLRTRVFAWVLLATLYVSFADMPWKARSIAWGEKITATLLALSITVTLMGLVAEIVGRAQAKAGGTTLIKYIINSLLLLLGVGVALGFYGVSVFPALTALGVGGLAVALAFQDTLANVFAGVNLTAAGQIRIGDYISLDNGVEGTVADIGWRTITLRTATEVTVFIPNKKLGEAVMTNYSRPGTAMSIDVPFRVPLDCDPEKIEAMVAEVLVAARADLPGMRDEPPTLRLRTIGDSALEFRAWVGISNFADRFALQHALLKRVIARLRSEGIPLPLPQRVVQLHGPDDAAVIRSAGR